VISTRLWSDVARRWGRKPEGRVAIAATKMIPLPSRVAALGARTGALGFAEQAHQTGMESLVELAGRGERVHATAARRWAVTRRKERRFDGAYGEAVAKRRRRGNGRCPRSAGEWTRSRRCRDHGDQKKTLPYVDAGVGHQARCRRAAQDWSHERGVYLHREAVALQGRNRLEGVVEVPGDPRTLSCVEALAPSRLRDTVLTPLARSASRFESVSWGVTEGASATGTLRSLALGDEFDESGLASGSRRGEYQGSDADGRSPIISSDESRAPRRS